jgi:signal transduction histidine kinase/CheY-like chemotaxis protein
MPAGVDTRGAVVIESGNASYSRAFVIVIFTVVIFSIFSLIGAAAQGFMTLIITAIFLTFICFVIIIMHSRSHAATEAFSIPFILFLANTFRCFATNDYSSYFSLCMVISCLGALFFNRRELLKLILVTNVIIAVQAVFYLPINKPEQNALAAMTLSESLLNWFIFFVGSVSVYLVTTFAEDKNNDARRAQDSFVGALSSTPDPMILLDSLNRVTYISNSFMKMIHVERPSHAKGRSVFDLLKDKNLKDLFYELLSKGNSSHTSREIILDGQQYFFEIEISKLSTEPRGYLISIVDITPVMKAKFEAEAASRSKSAFLATMSHEIRTPLNAIIGLSDIELQKDLSTDARINLEKIHSSGDALLAIINDILDISKIETGNFDLIPVDYDIPSLVNDTVQLNIVRIGSKNLVFKLKIDQTIPVRLFGDELRIKQILNNLLSNAFKYTEKGSVTLIISWEKRGDEAWVIFAIQDTGQGIRQQDIPKLFSEYRQLDAKANRHIEGTGLGLSITKNLVSLMDGKIGVESEYGKGSVFTVQIPQRIVDETPIGETVVQNLESFRFRDVYHNQNLRLVRSYMPYGKVLVVDDVETNLDVAKGLMLPYGLSVDTASSGPEAIDKIQAAGKKDEASRYDVIFMDHMMPGMDGLEAVRIIRSELPGNYGRTVPIIALTANALTGNEKMFLAHGCNAFISKPIDIMQLDTALNNWVRDKQSAETLKKAEMELAKTKKEEPDTSGILDNITIAGIDIVQGRQRYSGETTYLDIIRSWCLHTPVLLEQLKNLSLENLPDYSITVHGLKGSSYGICANEIGKEAEELEGFAKAGDFASVHAGNTAFIVMVETLLADLGKLLEKAASGKGAKKKAAAPDPALLAKLLDATKHYKSTLMEEILADIELYDHESGGELVLWLREQMDNLEYDAICNRLETAAN